MLALGLVVSCGGKSAEDRGREAAEAEAKAHGDLDKSDEAAPIVKKEPATVAKPDAAPIPEPTTPEEIDHARKQAMIDGREKDVVRFCEMQKIDAKSDPQAQLGCGLAACRLSDVDKARAWTGALPKDLKAIAVKTCLALSVVL
ncbi:MAG: hypothetical protein NT062_34925 [Proteobacteria bacterium]|nr:hypothetical protein [Pseudomonadota bacterium]